MAVTSNDINNTRIKRTTITRKQKWKENQMIWTDVSSKMVYFKVNKGGGDFYLFTYESIYLFFISYVLFKKN